MAWETLEAYIDAHILDKLPLKISADDDHNPTLHEIVDTFGLDYIYSGIAQTTTTPINDDKQRYYIARGTVGTYVNFLDSGGLPLTLATGEFAILKGVNNVWEKDSYYSNSRFLTPSDTPSTYASAGSYGVFVNAGETALEFSPVKKYTESKDDEHIANVAKLATVEDNATADQGGVDVPLTGYAIATSSRAITDSDSVQTAVEILELRVNAGEPAITADEATEIGLDITTTGDDKGMSITDGELKIGSPLTPHEAVIGEGDSYPVPVAYHCVYADFSGLVLTGAVDVTDILQSDSGSTVGLFGDDVPGATLLVGSDYPFGGAKVKIVTAMINGGSLTGEYLKDSSPTWYPAPFMSTLSEFPYTQYGQVICNADNTSEQLRFGFDPDDLPTTWAKVTLNINGIPQTKYWARFRITSPITSDAVIQQLKLHTSRWECNGDGTTEYFGRSRYPKTIDIHAFANAVKTPSNQNISIASGITQTVVRNKFVNSASDGSIISGVLPVGIDTSIPIKLEVSWYQDGTSSGDVELEVEIVKVSDGFIFDGTAVAETPVTNIVSVNNNNKELQHSNFKFLINDMLVGDTAILSLFRDATSGNLDDTLTDSIVITDYRLVGYFWR